MQTPDELVPEIIDRLPAPYGALLLLAAGGATTEEIAQRLGVPVESVPTMSSIARSKLRRLLAGASGEEVGDGR